MEQQDGNTADFEAAMLNDKMVTLQISSGDVERQRRITRLACGIV
jgi:hypothetical protein